MTTDIFEDFDEESQKLLERLQSNMLCFKDIESETIRQKKSFEAILLEKQDKGFTFFKENSNNNLKKTESCQ